MKERITKKELNNRFIVIDVPYGNLQDLLVKESPDYYTTRIEGWGCDVYCFPNPLKDSCGWVALATGYDTITRKGIAGNVWKLSRIYEKKARNLLEKTRYNFKKDKYTKTILRRWISQFISEILNEGKENK